MTRLQGLVKNAEDEAADLDCLVTELAENTAAWQAEWLAQRVALAHAARPANDRQRLAAAAIATAGNMDAALDKFDELREKMQSAASAAGLAAKALAEEATT